MKGDFGQNCLQTTPIESKVNSAKLEPILVHPKFVRSCSWLSMFISLPNLTLSFLTICEIIIFKVEEKVCLPLSKGDNNFLESTKPLSLVDMECASLDSYS